MENTERKGDGLEAFRKWLTPVLIVIVGWLVGQKMNDIDKKLDMVNVIQAAQAVLTNEVNNNRARLEKLENRLDDNDLRDNQPLYNENRDPRAVRIKKRIR